MRFQVSYTFCRLFNFFSDLRYCSRIGCDRLMEGPAVNSLVTNKRQNTAEHVPAKSKYFIYVFSSTAQSYRHSIITSHSLRNKFCTSGVASFSIRSMPDTPKSPNFHPEKTTIVYLLVQLGHFAVKSTDPLRICSFSIAESVRLFIPKISAPDP